MLNEILGTIVTVLAVVGVVLNNRKIAACFWLWIISNGISAYIHSDAGLFALTARDCIFLVLAVEGIYR
jgi:nicotinamide riboside transporter PnuC